MNTPISDPSTIRRRGLEALAQALGPVGMVRFLQQFEKGIGDYTADRHLWLAELDIQTIVQEIKARRKTG